MLPRCCDWLDQCAKMHSDTKYLMQRFSVLVELSDLYIWKRQKKTEKDGQSENRETGLHGGELAVTVTVAL